MSTGAIVAIAVVVVLVLLALLFLLPRMRARSQQRKLEGRRHEAAELHRTEAERKAAQAQLAEKQAKRERAEAELHAAQADLHDQGLADDDLDGDGRIDVRRSSTSETRTDAESSTSDTGATTRRRT